MLVEQSKEKTLKQIFTEKISPKENSKQQLSPIRKEILPWIQSDVTTNISSDTINFNEVIMQQAKDRNPAPSTVFQASRMEKTIELKPKKTDEFQSHREVPIVNNRQQEMSSEIVQYQQVIKSLRAELAEYRAKLNTVQPEIVQYDKVVNSLRSELAEYKTNLEFTTRNQKNNIDSLQSELAECKTQLNKVHPEIVQYQQVIKSLRSELAEYRAKLNAMQPEIVQYDLIIKSLRSELAEYKAKPRPITARNQQNHIDLLRSELAECKIKPEPITARNQQNHIDLLRSELAECKTQLNDMQPEIVQYDHVVNSLRGEISRLANNLNLMILK